MGTITKLTFDEYLKLPEQEGMHYELDEGVLLMEPSPTFRHNRIRDQIARRLTEFVKAHRLGEVTVETDFRLSAETVRSPDVALVTPAQLNKIDIDRSPIDGAPALAIEVISPSNLAQDTRKKVRQYLAAGCKAVWLVYPALRLVRSTMVRAPAKWSSRIQSMRQARFRASGFRFLWRQSLRTSSRRKAALYSPRYASLTISFVSRFLAVSSSTTAPFCTT
jgi:Uma2 family endonuclease